MPEASTIPTIIDVSTIKKKALDGKGIKKERVDTLKNKDQISSLISNNSDDHHSSKGQDQNVPKQGKKAFSNSDLGNFPENWRKNLKSFERIPDSVIPKQAAPLPDNTSFKNRLVFEQKDYTN